MLFSVVAAALLQEHDQRSAFHSIRDEFPFEGLAASYDIQADLVGRLCARRACKTVGYKIGLTSRRMQMMCGIPHPIAGHVLGDQVHGSGVAIALSQYVHLGIECEIAIRIAHDLPCAALPTTIEAMGRAVAAVAPAFELVDDRNADYRSLDMLTLIADNSWHAGVVLGDFQPSWPDLVAIEGIVERNGFELDRGRGRDVLGHPFEPLLWLVRHLAERGEYLRAGDLVMTGSLVPTCFPDPGDRVRFALAGLGEVEINFTP